MSCQTHQHRIVIKSEELHIKFIAPGFLAEFLYSEIYVNILMYQFKAKFYAVITDSVCYCMTKVKTSFKIHFVSVMPHFCAILKLRKSFSL
jgi:hypothetical protein